mmetsp:Transcript_3225/g.10050  ORF Transcript_3225/g.10050 Transcript_3225/m.10050 type:complete len:302 (+) Transcript_3225:992-1897(+)
MPQRLLPCALPGVRAACDHSHRRGLLHARGAPGGGGVHHVPAAEREDAGRVRQLPRLHACGDQVLPAHLGDRLARLRVRAGHSGRQVQRALLALRRVPHGDGHLHGDARRVLPGAAPTHGCLRRVDGAQRGATQQGGQDEGGAVRDQPGDRSRQGGPAGGRWAAQRVGPALRQALAHDLRCRAAHALLRGGRPDLAHPGRAPQHLGSAAHAQGGQDLVRDAHDQRLARGAARGALHDGVQRDGDHRLLQRQGAQRLRHRVPVPGVLGVGQAVRAGPAGEPPPPPPARAGGPRAAARVPGRA